MIVSNSVQFKTQISMKHLWMPTWYSYDRLLRTFASLSAHRLEVQKDRHVVVSIHPLRHRFRGGELNSKCFDSTLESLIQ